MTQILYAYISEENHQYLVKKYLDDFPEDFQKKVLAYKRWQDAQLSLLGRLLLKIGLHNKNKEYKNKTISYTGYQKPFLADCSVTFNISHAGEIVVCVLSENLDIGVDIEILSDISIEDYESLMTKRELSFIKNEVDNKVAFFDYWTQKEAVIKANGKGLSIPLKSFEIINNKTVIDKESFFLKKVHLDQNYRCHIAFKNGLDPTIENPRIVQLCDL
ncbi:4'-phosphopantetheinyl transferase superfamily protein [Flavobacterium sp. H4147]|uniref:4'-phosphopantetheinyl transferase family protein n=1 Tax=Flavobacterium sp. H4147 TaxID=3034149 RepID=UPI0023ECD7FC|nr:4'-phosphopantetheinyl transferase superfamily protein [Flavobacterium sp. H4147]